MKVIFFIIHALVAFNIITYAQESITTGTLPIGISSKYMGVTGSHSDFDTTVFKDLGINTNRIFSSVESFEPVDDNGDYGKPSINEIKANINIIPWAKWDNVINSNGLKTYLDAMKAIKVKVIINLRTNSTGWMANIPKTPEDENEWWEHCAALAYWLNVRNDYHIDDYQLFNEPDQGAGQEFGGASIEDYIRLARLANDAIGFVYTHYLPGRKFDTYGPVSSWANSWISDMLTKGGDVFSNVDFHQYASKTQFTDAIRTAHGMMNTTGYAGLPLWMTEWGSYDFDLPDVRQNNSVPFAIKMVNNIINMCAPGDGYVTGWEYYNFTSGSYGDEILDENKNPRTVYYALRLAIRGLKGGKPIYSCDISNNKLTAIASKDEDGTINLVVTDTSSIQSYTVNIDLSSLSVIAGSTTTIYRYDASNNDVSSVGPIVGSNGVIQITIPANGAVLIKAQGTGSGKDTQVPTSPTALTSNNATYNSVSLTWAASADNIGVEYYDLYINDILLKSAKGDANNLTVDKLKPSSAYNMYIKARDAAGNVAQSNTIAVTTEAAPTGTIDLPAPANLTASSTDTTVKLLWSLSSNPNVKGYKIFRDTVFIAVTSSSGYIIKGLTPDKMYTFKVSAIDSIVSVSPFSVISIRTEVSGVSKLTGTYFGFGPATGEGWYGEAFDGDINTFYDIYSVKPDGNGGYCGIDLGAEGIKRITKIRFVLARGSWAAGRIIGGKFQGSNKSDTSGYYDLYVIKNANDGIWNQITIDNSAGYRYLRYLAPDGSYGNISEIEFHGIDGTVSLLPPTPQDLELDGTPSLSSVGIKWKPGGDVSIKGYKIYKGNSYVGSTDSSIVNYTITGLTANTTYTFKVTSYDHSERESLPDSLAGFKITVDVDTVPALITGIYFGTNPAYAAGSEYDKAFDKDISTIFDYSQANGGYTGVKLNSINGKVITKIRFYPRGGGQYFIDRMIGGKFQGSNTGENEGYTDLYTVLTSPNAAWNEVVINDLNTYTYLRYLGPDDSYCDVAEIEFYGYAKTSVGVINLSGLDKIINIYPNPVTSATAIHFNAAEPMDVSVNICNVLGQEVLSIHAKVMGEAKIPIDLTSQENGLYIVKINMDGNVITKKIMK